MWTAKLRTLLSAGVVSLLFSTNLPCAAGVQFPTTSLYYTAGPVLYRSDLSGAGSVEVASYGGEINAIALDRRNGSVFWTGRDAVYATDLDGQNLRKLLTVHNGGPVGDFLAAIEVDPIHHSLYFTDRRNNIVYRSDTDGNNLQQIVPISDPGGGGLFDVNVDPFGGKVYWSFQNVLRSANLDGSDPEIVYTSSSSIYRFALDLNKNQVYWSAPSNTKNGGSIRRAVLGSPANEREVLVNDLFSPEALDLDLQANRLYFSDLWRTGPTDYDQTIRSAALDGSDQRVLFNFGSRVKPWALALDTYLVSEPNSFLAMLTAGLLGCLRRRRKM
jgi:hypothetical protein